MNPLAFLLSLACVALVTLTTPTWFSFAIQPAFIVLMVYLDKGMSGQGWNFSA